MSDVASTAIGLAGLQRQFLQRMRGGPADVEAQLADGQLPMQTGVGVYVHAYGARLRETLENDHQVLGTYLGDELWEALCAGYIAAYPSRFRSLRDFGMHLPDYLARAEPFSAQPQISELARFERRLLDSFDAADEDCASIDALQALPAAAWPALKLRLHPSLHLHGVAFNSVETWQAIKRVATPPSPCAAVHPSWALWRDHARVSRFRSIDAAECAAINHCMGGGDFSGLCELLRRWRGDADVPVAALGYLRSWCDEGWVSGWVSRWL